MAGVPSVPRVARRAVLAAAGAGLLAALLVPARHARAAGGAVVAAGPVPVTGLVAGDAAAAAAVSDLIEVTSEKAVPNPGLSAITFPVTGRGLSVPADAHGTPTAAGPSGKAVFTAAPPLMWDSAPPRR